MSTDATTLDAYRRGAATYRANRTPHLADRARALAADVGPHQPLLDLGCGTGQYLAHLGDAVVGVDPVDAMLDVARPAERPLVGAIGGDLPFRPGTFGGAWARNSLLHVPTDRLPIALADLHRALTDGAPVVATFLDRPAGEGERVVAGSDLPGRTFYRQRADVLHDLFVGAGFTDIVIDDDAAARRAGHPVHIVHARRARTLPDTVGPDLRLLVCGLNPSLHAADAGVGFVTPSNRFWPAAQRAGLVTADRDAHRSLRRDRVGMTDLVKRATRRADELSPDEYADGVDRVARLCALVHPRAVCMVGLAGWRAAVDRRAVAGWQDTNLGGAPVYVMPSTSGLNAHARLDDLVEHLRRATTPEAVDTDDPARGPGDE